MTITILLRAYGISTGPGPQGEQPPRGEADSTKSMMSVYLSDTGIGQNTFDTKLRTKSAPSSC